jgi:hypothetical protein
MLGAIGGGERLDSNVVGDTANLASRIEGLTKVYGVTVLFTEFTFERLLEPAAFEQRELDRVTVKGRAAPVTIYELLDGEPEAAKAQKLDSLDDFSKGLELYRAGEFDAARRVFEDCVASAPDDKTALLYVSRCTEYAATPPLPARGRASR